MSKNCTQSGSFQLKLVASLAEVSAQTFEDNVLTLKVFLPLVVGLEEAAAGEV